MAEPKTNRVGPQLQHRANTMLDLGAQLRVFAHNVQEDLNTVHRNISIKLFNDILFDTPVLTGMARGNWQVGTDYVPGGTLQRLDPTGALVKAEIEGQVVADTDQIAFFSNNLEYIVPLEYGWSNKAPEGMVRINVHRFRVILSEEAAKVRNKR